MRPRLRRWSSGALAVWLLSSMPHPAQADWFSNDQQAAYDRYQAGDYAGAAAGFQDPYRKGVALYRAGRYQEAEQSFGQVDSGSQRQAATYNQGNACFQRGDFTGAADAYREVLRAQPDNADAAHNLALTRATLARLEREERKQETERQRKQQDKKATEADRQEQQKQDGQSGKPGAEQEQSGSPSQSSKDQASPAQQSSDQSQGKQGSQTEPSQQGQTQSGTGGSAGKGSESSGEGEESGRTSASSGQGGDSGESEGADREGDASRTGGAGQTSEAAGQDEGGDGAGRGGSSSRDSVAGGKQSGTGSGSAATTADKAGQGHRAGAPERGQGGGPEEVEVEHGDRRSSQEQKRDGDAASGGTEDHPTERASGEEGRQPGGRESAGRDQSGEPASGGDTPDGKSPGDVSRAESGIGRDRQASQERPGGAGRDGADGGETLGGGRPLRSDLTDAAETGKVDAVERFDQLEGQPGAPPRAEASDGRAASVAGRESIAGPGLEVLERRLQQVQGDPTQLIRNQFRVDEIRAIQGTAGRWRETRPW